MKVCHLSTVHQYNDVRIFKKECVSLLKAGHEISFVVPHVRNENFQGIDIIAIPREESKFRRAIVQPLRLLSKALKIKPDVFHFHDFELWPVAILLRIFGYKVIADIHEDVPAQLKQRTWVPDYLKSPLSIASSYVENNFSRFMTGVIVADDTLRTRFETYNSNVLDVCNYPLLYELPKLANNCSFKVLSVGGVFNERCADLIINAAKKMPDVSFSIGGGIAESYQDLGWESENCHYLGRLPFEKVQEEYSKADIIIVMFSDAPNHWDIKSNRFFESMYAAKPVLVSAMPNWVDFINKFECGLAVDLKSESALIEAISKIKASKEIAVCMGENGREAVLNFFSWNSEELKLIDFYAKI